MFLLFTLTSSKKEDRLGAITTDEMGSARAIWGDQSEFPPNPRCFTAQRMPRMR